MPRMNAVEFALWMNGAAEAIGETPPTKAQWAEIRAEIHSAIGQLMTENLTTGQTAYKVHTSVAYHDSVCGVSTS